MVKKFALLGLIVAASGLAVRAQPPPPAVHAALKACKPDIARFCSQVPPGEGRVRNCMKAHLPELSEPCKEALFQAWLRD